MTDKRSPILSQRRTGKPPFRPTLNPDVTRPFPAKPGFPPDAEGYCVSTFTGRQRLMSDFFFRVNLGLIVYATDDDIANFTYADAYGLRAPPGYRLIIQNIFIPALCSLNVNAISGIADYPLTNAGGITQIGTYDIQGDFIGVYYDDAPIPGLLNYDQLLTGFPLYDPSEALLFGGLSLDCYIRVETGSIVFLRKFPNPETTSNPGSATFTYDIPYVEFRGQLEASDNRELTALGMSVDSVPVSEAQGFILDQKRIER